MWLAGLIEPTRYTPTSSVLPCVIQPETNHHHFVSHPKPDLMIHLHAFPPFLPLAAVHTISSAPNNFAPTHTAARPLTPPIRGLPPRSPIPPYTLAGWLLDSVDFPNGHNIV